MFMQILPADTEGIVLWILVVTILATIGLSLLRSFISAIVSFFILKKSQNEEAVREETRKFSIVLFIMIAGLIMIFAKESLATYINRPADELAFAGGLIILFSILVGGLTYRTQTEKAVNKVKNFRKKQKTKTE